MSTDISVPFYLSMIWIILYSLIVQLIFGYFEPSIILLIHMGIIFGGVALIFIKFPPRYPAEEGTWF